MNKDEKLAKALGKNLFEKIYSQVDEMPEELMSDKEKEFIEEFGLTNGFVNKIKKLLDGNDATHYLLPMKGNKNTVEMDLNRERTFNVLMLQENITVGQRVEKFVLEYWKNGEWKKATEGTTIGFKRLLEFPTVIASKVRLRILSSRLKPALSEVGLYFDKQSKKQK